MMHRSQPRFSLRALVTAAALGAALGGTLSCARAQTVDATAPATAAQRQFDQDVAACNAGNLATPQRDSCIRDAGQRSDRLRGLPPTPQEAISTDGRATVVAPSGSSSALRGSTTTTSGDGRATVVVPEAATATQ